MPSQPADANPNAYRELILEKGIAVLRGALARLGGQQTHLTRERGTNEEPAGLAHAAGAVVGHEPWRFPVTSRPELIPGIVMTPDQLRHLLQVVCAKTRTGSIRVVAYCRCAVVV